MQRLRQALAYLLRPSRERTVAAGVVLLGVPTAFQLMPNWAEDWPVQSRAGVLVCWAVIAVIAIAQQRDRDAAIDAMTSERSTLLRHLRLTGTHEVLAALLRSGARGIPKGYDFTLYLYDESSDELRAYFPKLNPKRDPDPRTFSPGRGATGSAWRDQQIVVVCGDDVSNEAYGLTDVQQDYYRGYRSVASAVIWEENTKPIGVITALSRDDDHYFDTVGGRDSLKVLAEVVGVVLNRIPDPDDLGLEPVTPPS